MLTVHTKNLKKQAIFVEGQTVYLDHYSKEINNRKKKREHTMTSQGDQPEGLYLTLRTHKEQEYLIFVGHIEVS